MFIYVFIAVSVYRDDDDDHSSPSSARVGRPLRRRRPGIPASSLTEISVRLLL